MRKRQRDVPAASQEIGRWTSRYTWESTWVTNYVYSNWSPGVAQAPYLTRETCWDEIHKGPPFKEGGPFDKWTSRVGSHQPTGYCNIESVWGDRVHRYTGAFVCAQPVDFFRTFFTWSPGYFENAPINVVGGDSTWGSVSSYGPTAWKRFQPGKSIADASVFIGELSDLPRMLRSTAKWFNREYILRFGKRPSGKKKELADAWLNAQFGWIPFISDLRKFYRAYVNMDRWYNQLVRQNGQWIKRKGSMVTSTKAEQVWYSDSQHMSVPDFTFHPLWYIPGVASRSKVIRYTDDKVWFEGSFRYYVPNIESVEFKRRAIAHLFGLDVNPAVLWELIPFSWLVDWCTNVGDILSSHSSNSLFNNLVARYAYLMGTKSERLEVVSLPAFTWRPKHVWTLQLERKTRREANNFGFGLSDGDLTARQWSILGALGISRMH